MVVTVPLLAVITVPGKKPVPVKVTVVVVPAGICAGDALAIEGTGLISDSVYDAVTDGLDVRVAVIVTALLPGMMAGAV